MIINTKVIFPNFLNKTFFSYHYISYANVKINKYFQMDEEHITSGTLGGVWEISIVSNKSL